VYPSRQEGMITNKNKKKEEELYSRYDQSRQDNTGSFQIDTLGSNTANTLSSLVSGTKRSTKAIFLYFSYCFLGLTKKKNQQYLLLLLLSHHLRRRSQERRLSLYLLLRNQLSPWQTLETCSKDINMSATRYIHYYQKFLIQKSIFICCIGS